MTSGGHPLFSMAMEVDIDAITDKVVAARPERGASEAAEKKKEIRQLGSCFDLPTQRISGALRRLTVDAENAHIPFRRHARDQRNRFRMRGNEARRFCT